MKKSLLLGTLLLMAAGAQADPIDLQKAKDIAADYASVNVADPVLVKRAVRDASKSHKLPASTAAAAPYYIFSRGEGQGYVIVSGDDCLPQVLGYTESGDFVEDQMPPQLLSWLESTSAFIENLQAEGLNESLQSEARRAAYTAMGVRKAATGRVKVDPLIQTHWHQSWPYFNRTPLWNGSDHSATGCVATAACQVLYYFHKDLPAEMQAASRAYTTWTLKLPVASVPKGTPLKWELMLPNYNSSHPAEYDDVISQFMLVVGASADMDYNSSSGTHIENLVSPFSSIFNVSSKHKWLEHTELDKIAYANMLEKRPIVYAGYNESNEGHAIVLDGYRPSDDTFHFNFGWGGQGDGWYILAEHYTKADGTTAVGVNGFGINPCIVYDVKPKNINVPTEITTPQGFYMNHTNPVKVSLSNKSTFPLEGVYLFMGTTQATPTNLTAAVDNTIINVPNDGSLMDFTFRVKPTSETSYYLTVTDEKLNVLKREKFSATTIGNQLRFKSLEILGTTETETHAGHDFTIVNGNYVTCVATVLNESNYAFQESPRLQLFVSEDDGETFETLGNKAANNTEIEAMSEGEFKYSFTTSVSVPLEYGKLYAAQLMDPLTPTTISTMTYDTDDRMVYFTLRESSGLKATLEGTTLKFTGDWSARDFEALVRLRSNAAATTFDLTEVQKVGHVPVLTGKEFSMILVGEDVDVKGVNVVNYKAGLADRLSLSVGSDFTIPAPIKANSVSLKLNATPGAWMLLTVPCDFTLPNGVFAKRIDSHSASGIKDKTTNVTELEAGHTYLLIVSSSRCQELTASSADGVQVLAVPVENADPAVVGTFVNEVVHGGYYINNDYFHSSADDFDVVAFGGYLSADDMSISEFRCSSTLTMDNVYKGLGESIAQAYDIYDKYSEIVTEEACQTLLENIAACEEVYTTRSLETTDARNLGKKLLELAEEFTHQLDTESMQNDFDMTYMIVNPSFERNATSATTASTWGWTVGTGVDVRASSNVNYRGVGADGDYLVYSATGYPAHGLGISQTIEELPAGIYAVTAMMGTDIAQTVTLFANDEELEVECSPYGIYYLREGRIDNILIRDGDALTLGVKDAPSWYKVDDFHLYYVRALTEEERIATGIDEVNSEQLTVKSGKPVYDITGRLVARGQSSMAGGKLPAGVYITDGKKVLVK